MHPIEYIRRHVFDELSQAAFGGIAGTTQATVSRWENNELSPNSDQMRRIRTAATDLGKDWNDRWFFEAPEKAPQEAEQERAAS